MSIGQGEELNEKFEKLLIEKYFGKPDTSNIRHDYEDFIKHLSVSHDISNEDTNDKTPLIIPIQAIKKEKVLEGLVFHVEIIHNDEDKSNCFDDIIQKHGGVVSKELNENVTYEINHNGNINTLEKAFQLKIPILNPLFIDDSISKGYIQEVKEYQYKYDNDYFFFKRPLYKLIPLKSIYGLESNSEDEGEIIEKKLNLNTKKTKKIKTIKEVDELDSSNIVKPSNPTTKINTEDSKPKKRSKSEGITVENKKDLDSDNKINQIPKSILINKTVLFSQKNRCDTRIKRYPNKLNTEPIGRKLFKRIKSTENNLLYDSTEMFKIFKYLSQNKTIVNEKPKNDIIETITIDDFPIFNSYNQIFSNVEYYIKERPTKDKVSDTDGLRFLLNKLGAKEAKTKGKSNIYFYHNRKKLSNNSIDYLYSKDIFHIINQIIKEDLSETRRTKPLSINKLLSLINKEK